MVTNTLIDINEMIDKPNIYTKQSETVIFVGYSLCLLHTFGFNFKFRFLLHDIIILSEGHASFSNYSARAFS